MATSHSEQQRSPVSARPAESRPEPEAVFEESASSNTHDRVREAGLGYGRSSGYGTRLHFEDGHVDPMFRSHW